MRVEERRRKRGERNLNFMFRFGLGWEIGIKRRVREVAGGGGRWVGREGRVRDGMYRGQRGRQCSGESVRAHKGPMQSIAGCGQHTPSDEFMKICQD